MRTIKTMFSIAVAIFYGVGSAFLLWDGHWGLSIGCSALVVLALLNLRTALKAPAPDTIQIFLKRWAEAGGNSALNINGVDLVKVDTALEALQEIHNLVQALPDNQRVLTGLESVVRFEIKKMDRRRVSYESITEVPCDPATSRKT